MTPLIDSQLEILRRIAERGKKLSEEDPVDQRDVWIHMLDEIARLKIYLQEPPTCS